MRLRTERRISLVAVVAFYAIMAAIGIGGSLWLFDTLPVRIGERSVPPTWSVGIGVAFAGLVVLFSRYSHANFEWARALDDNFHDLLGDVSPTDAAVMALSSGLAEELLFRGFVLRLFLPWEGEASVARMVLAAVISSILFGALHTGSDRSYLPWTAFATLMGGAFAAMTLWTGDITAAVVAHLTVNYFNFLALGSQADA